MSKAAVELEGLVSRWDERLADLGGDPAGEDWGRFRPLRLRREEDWSDWLGHLLERSTSGRFAGRLLGRDVSAAGRWRVRSAEREVVAEDHRADLVLRFDGGEWMHVEVKVGDLHLDKTPRTGQALQSAERGVFRGNILLLPEEDLPAWRAGAGRLPDGGASVLVRTWTDVAVALRESIQEPGSESVTWRVWAAAFTGAVEQKILGHRMVPRGPSATRHRSSSRDVEQLHYLKGLIKSRREST